MVNLFFMVATVILAALTLLPVWRYEAWWVRSLDFPRLQLSILSLVLMVLELAFLDLSHPWSWIPILITLACLSYHSWWIAPYTPLFPIEVKPASQIDSQQTIRIMTANVLATNRNSATLIKLVHDNDPDILVTLESDMWWQSKLDDLERDYPFTIKCPQDNLYGMHVYSKLPFSDSQIDFLVQPDVPSMHTLVQIRSGQPIRMHFLHPAPPSPTENDASSERDAELLIVAKSVDRSDLPVVVTGDLNDVAWSETTRLFRKISGLLDPRVGRGQFNTFHADYWFIRWPLDHLFHSGHFTLSSMHRLPRFGSDHFALLTELVLDPTYAMERNGLNADRDDVIWADRKIDRQDVDPDDVHQPGKHDQAPSN